MCEKFPRESLKMGGMTLGVYRTALCTEYMNKLNLE